MKGILVQTTLYGEKDLISVIKSGKIGKDSKLLGSQPPLFRNNSLVFCSYVCNGYPETYGNREGVSFETDAPVMYACPIDTFELMRGGNWLPGYEKFIFPSIEAMLSKYPKSVDFKKEFQEFFSKLKPQEVYPRNSKEFAESQHRLDYCLDNRFPMVPTCNEVTFNKPLEIRNCRMFTSKQELEVFYRI